MARSTDDNKSLMARSALRPSHLLYVPAALGALFMRLYWPQCRMGRRAFLKGFAIWALLGIGSYQLLDPIADAAWISDEAIVAVARALPWLTGAWMLALMAMLARRAHDWGLSGVDFTAGINQPTYEYYIDFASRNGRAWPSWDEAD